VEGINGAGRVTAKNAPYSEGLDMGTAFLPVPKNLKTTGTLTAFNVDSGAQIWQDKFPVGLVGGATATAGGLLFVQVSGLGVLDAINPVNGKILASWHLGERIDAGPSVAMVNGREYILVSLGGSGPQYGGMAQGHSALVALALG
jgi:alcohol dehydrogenase (cytochrome c)